MTTLGKKQSPEHIRKRIAAGLTTRATNFVPKPPRPCSVAGCDGFVRALSVCDMHYQRIRNHGSTDLPAKAFDVAAYLAERTRAVGDCLVWCRTTKTGYGVATACGRTLPAHVLAWTAANGPVPEGLQINHRCHNRACVNVDHLYAGTQKQNMADMREAGRGNHARGERTAAAKLTEEKVREIRAATDLAKDLCRRYGVSESLIRAVRKRHIWAHVA